MHESLTCMLECIIGFRQCFRALNTEEAAICTNCCLRITNTIFRLRSRPNLGIDTKQFAAKQEPCWFTQTCWQVGRGQAISAAPTVNWVLWMSNWPSLLQCRWRDDCRLLRFERGRGCLLLWGGGLGKTPPWCSVGWQYLAFAVRSVLMIDTAVGDGRWCGCWYRR